MMAGHISECYLHVQIVLRADMPLSQSLLTQPWVWVKIRVRVAVLRPINVVVKTNLPPGNLHPDRCLLKLSSILT